MQFKLNLIFKRMKCTLYQLTKDVSRWRRSRLTCGLSVCGNRSTRRNPNLFDLVTPNKTTWRHRRSNMSCIGERPERYPLGQPVSYITMQFTVALSKCLTIITCISYFTGFVRHNYRLTCLTMYKQYWRGVTWIICRQVWSVSRCGVNTIRGTLSYQSRFGPLVRLSV